jgi:hypothetical protein
MRSCSAALLVALAVSCAPGTGPGQTSPPIRTDRDRYVLEPTPYGHEARLVTRFTAPQDTTVHILHCNGAIMWGLQRRTDGRWIDAWIATTNGCLSTPKVVAAGASHVETLTVVSRTDIPPNQGTVQHEVPPGTYRVVWYQVLTSFDMNARPLGPELALEGRVSGPFTIERAP